MIINPNPDSQWLSNFHWQVFGSLTFKQERMPKRIRLAMYYKYLRIMEKKLKLKKCSMHWVLRGEFGEHLGRFHYHYLLSGIPCRLVNLTTMFFLKDLWEKIGGGFARVRKFQPDLEGVDYVIKGLESTSLTGANQYEFGKFDGNASELIVPAHTRKIARAMVRTGRVLFKANEQ